MDDVSRIDAVTDEDGERVAAALGHLLSRWWLVLLGAMAGAGLAVAGLSVGAVDPSARATLSLTDEVDWPYYERGRLEQATAAEAIAAAFVEDHGLVSAAVSAPPENAILLYVEVEASSPVAAAEAANELADAIVAGSSEVAGERLDAELERLDAELASVETELAELSSEQEVLIEAEAAARQAVFLPEVTAEDRAELERVEAARLPVDAAVFDTTGFQSDLSVERLAVVAERDAAAPQLVVVAPAATTDPRERNVLTMGVLGVMAGAVLASAIALSWLPRR